MLLDDVLIGLIGCELRYKFYIVFDKKSTWVLHMGFDKHEAEKHETRKTRTLLPLVKW